MADRLGLVIPADDAFGHEAHTVLGEHEARAGKPQAIDQRSGH
jgi:hypothetical protein